MGLDGDRAAEGWQHAGLASRAARAFENRASAGGGRERGPTSGGNSGGREREVAGVQGAASVHVARCRHQRDRGIARTEAGRGFGEVQPGRASCLRGRLDGVGSNRR
jgi:hypothetical protein